MRALRFALPLALLVGSLSAERVETAEVYDVAEYVDNHSWVLFDVDNTLIRSAQQLGSAQWADHQVKEMVDQGVSRAEAVMQVLKRWGQVHRLTRVELVDPHIVRLLEALHAGRVPVIAITGRLPRYADITEKELASVDLALGKTAPSATKVFDNLPGQPEYRAGVFHIGVRISKGAALKELLQALSHKPRRLVVVDDDAAALDEMEGALKEMGVECIAIHYLGAQAFVNAFNPSLAQKQWEYLGRVLSDNEVRLLEGEAI